MRTLLKQSRIQISVAIAAGLTMVVLGCSGDGGSGSDEEYVEAICVATDELSDVILQVFSAPSRDNVGEIMTDAYRGYRDALRDANPPDDMEQYHGELVAIVEEAVDLLDAGGNPDEAFAATGDLEDPPQAVQDRLTEAAQNVEACEGSEFFSS